MFPKKKKSNNVLSYRLVILVLVSGLILPGCDEPAKNDQGIPLEPEPYGDSGGSGVEAYLAEESSSPAQTGEDSTGSGSGDLKPIGFLNYGEFDAVVMPYTYIPLGESEQALPAQTSTVSSANDGVGDWPNTSRYLTVPMGTYSWCVDWEEGDLDEDGQIDYFHYIQNDPTLLDEEDSDELEFAEEVVISAPPSSGAIYEGRCELAPIQESCAGQSQHVQVYSSPGWIIGSDYQSDLRAYANTAEFPPPEEGITVTSGGGYGFQKAWILYQAGEYLEVTFDGLYTAVGVQPHGESSIGWARVLFDGVEVWRGDTSAYWHDDQGYLHAVYIEVRCFPPGTHALRIECLGQVGSGGALGSGGKTDVPISHFGFRK
jgi:hypothetical protein